MAATPADVSARDDVPTGDPPADTEQAEAEIKAAYAGLGDEQGDSLPNVEVGYGLAPTARRAAQRAFESGADIAVQEIKFLSDVRAAVVFTISTRDGRPLLGKHHRRSRAPR